MLIFNGVVHPVDAPVIPNGYVELEGGKIDPPPRPPRPAGGQGGFAPRPSGPRQGGYAPRQGGGRSGGFSRQPSEPESFEERLKHFMQASDSKLSEMKYTEKRSSRRGGRK